MDALVPFLLTASVFLLLEWVWRRPPTRALPSPGVDEGRGGPAVHGLSPDRDPFSLPSILCRIDILAAELARLDGDPQVFAKAFRTQVAQSAYRALLADAARLHATAVAETRTAPSRSRCPEVLEM